ncbi:RNA methyltransferase [Leeia sp. TBRC 13508]|uniref:RNA methyltransferase n=1 Tax=Leeia speluncae TaxID=2884804 RepID=A0ABS8D6K9_9NEIS|nr:RNA methyltransferase [Leeia speluncae]MCB6183611.1 RNA methyltransferase [Leeia speluncae]
MMIEQLTQLQVINSSANPRFKQLGKLISSKRERKQTGLIVLDGMHLLTSAKQQQQLPVDIYLSESGLSNQEILDFLSDLERPRITLFSDVLFSQLTELSSQTGIMATLPLPQELPLHANDKQDYLVLDGVQDPGNVGSILRTAAAAGVSQVVLSTACADAWSPKVLRAGMGAHFSLSIHMVSDVANWLRTLEHGVKRVVTSLQARSSLFDVDLTGPVAWVFGSEGAGVSEEVERVCETPVLIPMIGMTESLNVGAAAAVCMFEQLRQRTKAN